MIGPEFGYAFPVEPLAVEQSARVERARGPGAGCGGDRVALVAAARDASGEPAHGPGARDRAEDELVADRLQKGTGRAGGHDEDQSQPEGFGQVADDLP